MRSFVAVLTSMAIAVASVHGQGSDIPIQTGRDIEQGVSWAEIQRIPWESQVDVNLTSGRRVRGQLQSVDNSRLLLSPRSSLDSSRAFLRAEVSSVTVRRIATSFRTEGTVNPVHVGSVVGALAVGTKVFVRTSTGQRLSGTIQSIDADRFTLALGRNRGSEAIAFEDVSQINRGRSGLKWGLGIGAAVFGFLVLNYARMLSACNCS